MNRSRWVRRHAALTARFSQRGGAAVLALLVALLIVAGAAPKRSLYLYLLAAVPSRPGLWPIGPAELYGLDAEGRIDEVREIVGSSPDSGAGVAAVRSDQQQRIFVLSPADAPWQVNFGLHIIDETKPLSPISEVLTTTPGLQPGFDGDSLVLAAADRPPTQLLITKQGAGIGSDKVVLRVPGSAAAAIVTVGPRPPWVIAKSSKGDWSDYDSLRFEGAGAGPWLNPAPRVRLDSQGVSMPLAGNNDAQRSHLAPLPPPLRPAITPGSAAAGTILAATARFLLFNVQAAEPGPWTATTAYLLDRHAGTWRRLQLPTSNQRPSCRIFGDWLATPVQQPPPAGTPSPAPPAPVNWTQAEPDPYASYAGGQFTLPGAVALLNLADGRSAMLSTGRPDTEILDISADGRVTYRVEDSIYSASLVGDGVGPATLMARAARLREVHWVFWSAVAPKPLIGYLAESGPAATRPTLPAPTPIAAAPAPQRPAQVPAGAPYLYLLSAAPKVPGFWPAYPADLYALTPGLTLVRRLVPAQPNPATGVAAVRADQMGNVYVISPLDGALLQQFVIDVIHEDDPARLDRTTMQTNPDEPGFALASTVPISVSGVSRLFITASYGGTILGLKEGISGGRDTYEFAAQPADALALRLQPGKPDDLANLRYPGAAAGAWSVPQLNARVVPAGIAIPLPKPHFYGPHLDYGGAGLNGMAAAEPYQDPQNPAVLSKLPQIAKSAVHYRGSLASPVEVIAASERYFIFSLQPWPQREPQTAKDWAPALAYVHDLHSDSWRAYTLPTPTCRPAARLFGDWLTVPELLPKSTRPGFSPRVDSPPPPLPYLAYQGPALTMPGVIFLLNLADGRSLKLATGDPDSEVLDLNRSGQVIYRVGGKIYAAIIQGSTIGLATLVANDPRLVDVHWAFWSGAKPTPPRASLPPPR